MKEFTKFLKKEAKKDKFKMMKHNNKKWKERNENERNQSLNDKKKHYRNKWESIIEMCETPAQLNICCNMLDNIEIITRV